MEKLYTLNFFSINTPEKNFTSGSKSRLFCRVRKGVILGRRNVKNAIRAKKGKQTRDKKIENGESKFFDTHLSSRKKHKHGEKTKAERKREIEIGAMWSISFEKEKEIALRIR